MKQLCFLLFALCLLLTACDPHNGESTGSTSLPSTESIPETTTPSTVESTDGSTPESTVESSDQSTSESTADSTAITEPTTDTCPDENNNMTDAEPVIYLYPETETTVHVEVAYQGELTVTIPPYENGWTVTAAPDGTLTDKDGKIYPYLFWEGKTNILLPMDEGFCVKGEETEAFLLDILPRLGLIEREYTEFIDFWLPCMEGNPYNVITFQTDAYEALAPLTVSPAPDVILRVFMSFRASETPIELPEQEIEPFTRHGFTVIEWGGREQ